MSVAFVKEESAEAAAEIQLPERPISPHPNLVTEAGLKQLETQLREAQAALEVAGAIEDINERRRRLAIPSRDARYFAERLRTAEPMPDPDDTETVAFGHVVTFSRDDGRVQTYRIVGEDQADPRAGTMSFASPMARALLGKAVGDVVGVGNGDVEIVRIG